MMEKLYTLKEASKLLGVHVRTIQRWDKEKKIKYVRTVCEKRRVPESEIKRIWGFKKKGR